MRVMQDTSYTALGNMGVCVCEIQGIEFAVAHSRGLGPGVYTVGGRVV